MIDAPVVIAGGGPVGMMLSLELAHHGIRSIVLERNLTTTRHPKMDITNGRSMELLGRFGFMDRLRAAGIPETNSPDIVWVSNPRGHLLHRFSYPTAEERRREMLRNDGTLTAEPAMRISQIVLEPLLKDAVDRSPLAEARFGYKVDEFSQEGDRVLVKAQDVTTGETTELSCSYLIGCDGGGSTVRRQLGIGLEGKTKARRSFMVHFRSSDRKRLAPFGIAWHLQWAGGATLIAQNDRDIWTLHMPLAEEADDTGIRPEALLRQHFGDDFEDFEVLVANSFFLHMVVAEQYQKGRVLLAGDSAHQVMPFGGYGMNTGVGDAVDLGWKLAATLNGWGGPALLQSYERERRPIAVQNRAAAERNAAVRREIAALFAAEALSTASSLAEAETCHISIARRIRELGNAENESWGIEYGYNYLDSPLIVRDGNSPLSFDPLRYEPTSRPGYRLPHLLTSDGSSLHSRLGREFTLIAVGRTEAPGLFSAAEQLSVPVAFVQLDESEATSRLLERRLLLVRPDQMIAWRGDAEPSNPGDVLNIVTGRASRATEDMHAQ
jgi:2-polyprenyl-6-methoxyphenol hydroxylase-like FAD-dependent oxidoreductase